jgi:hypothetical protein
VPVGRKRQASDGALGQDRGRHPQAQWVYEFPSYGTAKTVNDATREALGVLAAAHPGQKLKPIEWAKLVVELGLAKTLISANERDTVKGRERAMGVLLKKHIDETFEAGTEAQRLVVRLEGGYRRWDQGQKPHTRYVFTIVSETAIPLDA